MTTYEFTTQFAETGQITIPLDYVQAIPTGSMLRVILLVEEAVPIVKNGHVNETHAVNEDPYHQDQSGDASWDESLEEFVRKLKKRPLDPATVHIGNMERLLACLSNPVTEADPNFDEAAWNVQWQQIEEEMDAIEFQKALCVKV